MASDRKKPNRYAEHALLYRMSFGQKRRFLTLVWVFQQRPDHKEKPWTRKRVIDLALRKLIEEIENRLPDRELPEIPDEILDGLK